jgi:eukaryotic-like serine/threonine-protein kinase
MNQPTPLPETWAPGALIPGTVYRIIRPIGQGGMGEVYEVEHEMLGTRRALKVLVKHYAGREDLAERLRVEARGLARLKHPNLVEVYDLGTAGDGRIFFAMEMLDGVTLRAMLRDRGRLSVRTSVELIVQVLAGLHVAHLAGILHRDVKPENVFVCRDGTVKLLDFGVAKAIDAWMPDQKITGVGMTVGTPRYMSPEQAEGAAVDARTDVYATGQVLWEMLAGRPAFEETDPFELAQAKWKRGVPPLDQVRGVDAPPALCEAVDRACRADPAKRHLSAEAFILALRSAIGASAPAPSAPPMTPSTTQAYLAGAGTPDTGGDTAFNPLLPGGFGGTVPVPGAAARELTERVDAIRPVNRDARTEAHASGPRPKGPGGTELLPAVAARQEPAVIVAPSVPPASAPATSPARQRAKSGPLGITLTSWIAGFAAFAIPVIIAAALAFWQLRDPPTARDESAPAATGSTLPSDTGVVEAEPSAPEPIAEATVSSEPENAPPGSGEPESAPSASAFVAPIKTTPTKTAPPVTTPAPPRTSPSNTQPPRKMPGSGL